MKVTENAKARRLYALPLEVASLPAAIRDCSGEAELLEVLGAFKTWNRTEICDLRAWTDALNRFDTVLDEALHQCVPILPHKHRSGEHFLASVLLPKKDSFPRQLVLEILRVTRLLFKNCSRSAYNSWEVCSELFVHRCSLIFVRSI